MQRGGLADSDGAMFTITLRNTPAAATRARKALIRFVQRFDLADDIVADIQTAVGEALANAAEHGRRPLGTICVRARIAGDSFAATISDDGPGFSNQAVARDHPPALSPHGFGLFLMRSLVDELEFSDGGQTVDLRKRLSRQ